MNQTESLYPDHRAMLLASGLNESVIADRGYFTAATKDALRALGFSKDQQRVPALVVPIHGPDGKAPVLHQIRPDSPRVQARPGKEPRFVKYETPAGASMVLDIPPAVRAKLGDPSTPLWITEGVKKADCAVANGLACVALLGVYNFKGKNKEGGKVELSAWDRVAFNERTFFIAYDSDSLQNSDVHTAMVRLALMIERRGGSPRFVTIPSPDGRKVGLDDYLADGGDVQTLIASARRDAPGAPPRKRVEGGQTCGPTDLSNAEKFVAVHGHEIRYCEDAGGWFFWDGMRWRQDRKGRVHNLFTDLTKVWREDAMSEEDEEVRKERLRHCDRTQSARGIRDILSLAAVLPGIAVTPDEFDQNLYFVNVRNGIVDARDGSLMPHDPGLLITKLIDIEYREDAQCERFLDFLRGVIPDLEVQEFMWRFAGYCLTGDTREQCFVFLHGNGRNGKSSFIWLMRSVAGDYAGTMEVKTLIDRKSGLDAGQLSTVAQLKGKRMVVSSEPDEGGWLNEGFIKDLTGGEAIRAKFMHSNAFEFMPTFKILVSSNHKPRIRGTDSGIWRRPRLVPFNERFEGDKDVRGLKESIFEEEAAGILRWMIRGAVEWFRGGLTNPAVVMMATEELRKENDLVGQFLDERTQANPIGAMHMGKLYAEYVKWCSANGHHAPASSVLGRRMKAIWDERGLVRDEVPATKEKIFRGFELIVEGYSDFSGGDE